MFVEEKGRKSSEKRNRGKRTKGKNKLKVDIEG